MQGTSSATNRLTMLALAYRPRYNERPEYALCHSNTEKINLLPTANASTWAVVSAFKFSLDTSQLKYNYWKKSGGDYDPTRMDPGTNAAVRLISYWTFGTDMTNISTPDSQSHIRHSIWGCEEYQHKGPYSDDDPLDRMKYNRNIRALDESIVARSWRAPQPRATGSGFAKTDIDIGQVAVYLRKEYQLLCKSLEASDDQHRNDYVQELHKTLFEPLEKAAEEFTNRDPELAALVKSEWIDSFDRALNKANLPGRVGVCNDMTQGL